MMSPRIHKEHRLSYTNFYIHKPSDPLFHTKNNHRLSLCMMSGSVIQTRRKKIPCALPSGCSLVVQDCPADETGGKKVREFFFCHRSSRILLH